MPNEHDDQQRSDVRTKIDTILRNRYSGPHGDVKRERPANWDQMTQTQKVLWSKYHKDDQQDAK